MGAISLLNVGGQLGVKPI